MCLLVFKSAKSKVSDEKIQNAWNNNSDGAGIAWAMEDGVHMLKGFMTLEDLKSKLHLIEGKPAILHFRIASIGEKSEKNCHPFKAGGGWVMAHNGTIGDIETKGEESDTSAFARSIMKPMLKHNPKILFEEHTRGLLQERIGTGSKMVFMNHRGDRVFLNEHRGDWEDGVWYSNYSHKWDRTAWNNSGYSNHPMQEYFPGMYGPEYVASYEIIYKDWNEDGTSIDSMCGGLFTRKVSLNNIPGPWEEHMDKLDFWKKNWRKEEESRNENRIAKRRAQMALRNVYRNPNIQELDEQNGRCDLCDKEFPNGKGFWHDKEKNRLCLACSLEINEAFFQGFGRVRDFLDPTEKHKYQAILKDEILSKEEAEMQRVMGSF